MGDQPIHSSNHNLVGLTPEEQARYSIDSALEGPKERWKALQEGAGRCPEKIETLAQAEAATTLVAQLQALLSRVDGAHQDVKEPWLEAGRVVDRARGALFSPVKSAMDDIAGRLTAFQLREQARIEAERLALAAKEEEDPEPGWAPPATKSRHAVRVRSVEGASAHLASTVDVEIVDIRLVPDRYLKRAKVLAALRAEILPDARKGDEIEGIKVHRGATTRVTK